MSVHEPHSAQYLTNCNATLLYFDGDLLDVLYVCVYFLFDLIAVFHHVNLPIPVINMDMTFISYICIVISPNLSSWLPKI